MKKAVLFKTLYLQRIAQNPVIGTSPSVQVEMMLASILIIIIILFFLLKVEVQYENLRTRYTLTPSRKHIGRAVARGSRMAIVTHCLKDAMVQQHIISKFGKLLQSEVATLCSNRCISALRCPSNKLALNGQENAPTILSLFTFSNSDKA